MRKITGPLVIALLLMLISTSFAYAQSDDDSKMVFCGELSAADCELLTESESALWTATSGESATYTALFVDQLDEPDSAQATVAVANRTMFVTEQAILDRMEALAETDIEEITADKEVLVEALMLPLSVDNASATVVELSPDLTARISQALRLDIPSEQTFETRLIDGILYVNMTSFSQFIPAAGNFGEWIGIDLMAFMPQVMENRLNDPELDLEEIAEEVAVALTPPGKVILAQPYLVKVEPGDEEMFNDFLEILPLRNAELDGQAIAVYRMKMDVPAYAGSPAFADNFPGFRSAIERVVPNEMASDRDVAGTVINSVGRIVLRDSDAVAVQGIGFEDAYLYGMEMDMGMSLFGRRFDVQIQSANANINSLEEVPVPANAFVPPIRLILGLIETFSGNE